LVATALWWRKLLSDMGIKAHLQEVAGARSRHEVDTLQRRVVTEKIHLPAAMSR
jgi:hypothetical protein